jgi:predicted flap endonuclease-1-like 5' DNA nuclease
MVEEDSPLEMAAAVAAPVESVIILPAPATPPAPEISPASILADELQVDVAASVVPAQPQAEPVVADVAASHLDSSPPPEPILPTSAPAPEPVVAPITRTALEDPEAAAMRAIEGNWTPRRRAAQNPVPHPDQTPVVREVDDAMQTARSAVAAASAAAAAAIAEAQERPRRPASAEGLNFEQRSEAMAKSFLEGGDALPADPAAGLSFEPEHPLEHQSFGRPQALPEPREGSPDNLKQIKGITPALEASLHGLGIFHFDQIAAWDQKAVVWIEQHLSLHGRIGRDKWLEQARELGIGRGQTLRPVRR